jgi:hypothetical protein
MPKYAAADFQPRLRALLADHGWVIEQEEPCRNDRWFLAIWTVRSRWLPVNVQFYLVFEYDDHFCWVAIAADEPRDHASTHWQGERLYLKRNWEGDLPAFFATLDELRQQPGRRE